MSLFLLSTISAKVRSRDIGDIRTDPITGYYSNWKEKGAIKRKRLRNRESRCIFHSPFMSYQPHSTQFPPLANDCACVVSEAGYVWIDYCCAPQAKDENGKSTPELAKAIASITSYVELSTFFITLCPEITHQELGVDLSYGTYLSRGWCRLELLSSLLSRYGGYEILVREGSIE